MSKFFKGLWNDESGAAGAEYALLLAIVAVGIAVAAGSLGDAISGELDCAADLIEGTVTTC